MYMYVSQEANNLHDCSRFVHAHGPCMYTKHGTTFIMQLILCTHDIYICGKSICFKIDIRAWV